ncbi:MAG: EamA family transporter [Anaerolineales bacterium]|jgi:drug/metabolite transporter (DMT)-like permease
MNVIEKPSFAGLALVVLATACWSTSGILINWVVSGSGISAVGLAFWRDFTTFSVLLIGFGLFRPGLLKVKRRDLPWLAAMGAISIGSFHVLWNTNVLLNGASIATVIQCNAPIFVTLMAWLIWREPLNSRKIIAIGMSVVGTVLIARLDRLSGMQITVLGLTVGLLSAITYGTFSLFGKKLSGSYNSWTILVYTFGFGTLALVPLQFGRVIPWPLGLPVLANFIALILLPTILGFGLYTLGLSRLQASVASITATTEVPFASFLAYFALGERLDFWQIIGALFVITGVVLVSLSRRVTYRRPQILAKEGTKTILNE